MKRRIFEPISDLNNLIRAVYLLIIFLLPLYFALTLKTNSVFELNKLVLFKVGTLVFLFLVIIRTLYSDNILPVLKKLIRIKNRIFLLLLASYILIISISSLMAKDINSGVYGAYAQHQGLVAFIFYFLFFILIILSVNSYKKIYSILAVISISSAVVSIYGFIQALGWDPLLWNEITFYRVSSTLGQPNHLAAFLIIAISITFYLFLTNTRKIKFLWLTVLFLNLFCLFFTYSRSGYLGLIAGFIIFLILYIVSQAKKINKKLYIIVFSFVLAAIILFSIFSNSFLPRIKEAFNPKSGGFSLRINYWESALKSIKEKPLLGHGLDNTRDVYYTHYKKDWAVFSNINSVPNRAHNIILDTALASGLIGLFLFLLLILYIAILIKKIINYQKYRIFGICMAASLGGYFTALMFGFATITTQAYMWLLFALVIITNNLINKKENEIIKENKGYQIPRYLRSIFLVLFSLLIVYFAFNNIKILVADHYFWELRNSVAKGEIYTSFVFYDYIEESNNSELYYKRQFVLALAQIYRSFYEESLRVPALHYMKEILKYLENNTYENVFARAEIYSALLDEDESYFERSKSDYEKSIALASGLPQTHRGLANLHLNKKNYLLALKHFHNALLKTPDINNPALNIKHKELVKNEQKKSIIGISRALEGLGLNETAKEVITIFNKEQNITNIYSIIEQVYAG
ncbi:O-antigen ligase family protein [Candidatus Parcubacteria bacterium]|nr:O-antigen ligase family protein [Candidatus Parcubacteria bacterium]